MEKCGEAGAGEIEIGGQRRKEEEEEEEEKKVELEDG